MPKPLLQALVLADHVYKDQFTGKMVIAGTFNRVFFAKPQAGSEEEAESAEKSCGARKMEWREICKAGSPFAYISLTDVRGEVPLELRYVDLTDNLAIMRLEFRVQASSPLDTVEAMIQLPPLFTPHAGVYALELLADNEPLGSHRVTAVEIPASEQKTGDESR